MQKMAPNGLTQNFQQHRTVPRATDCMVLSNGSCARKVSDCKHSLVDQKDDHRDTQALDSARIEQVTGKSESRNNRHPSDVRSRAPTEKQKCQKLIVGTLSEICSSRQTSDIVKVVRRSSVPTVTVAQCEIVCIRKMNNLDERVIKQLYGSKCETQTAGHIQSTNSIIAECGRCPPEVPNDISTQKSCEVTSAYFSGPDSSPYHRKNPRSNHHVRFSLPSPRPDETSTIEAPQNASVEGAQTPDKAAARADSRSRKAHADPKHGSVTSAPSEADAGDREKAARGYGSGCVSAAARAVAQSRALRCVSLTGVD